MIDAHQHFWQFDPIRDAWIDPATMSVIRRDFMPTDLEPLLYKRGIEGCVAVQADQSETETHFLLDLAAQNAFIKGVVGWIDLKADTLSQRLDYFRQFDRLKGFRHILQGEKPAFMLDPRFVAGVKLLGQRGYTYDILVFPRHLKAVRTLLRHLGNQPLVIDHLAKPYIKRGLIKQWAKDLRTIARHEHVYCKLSGMVTEAHWQNHKPTDFRPYIDEALNAFGPKRLMYGSDWPVCLVAASYEAQFSLLSDHLSHLSSTERAQIFGENARRFYQL